MKIVVVDLNKIFSALLKDSAIRTLLLSTDHRFIAPNYIIVELFEKYPRIVQYSTYPVEEIISILNQLIRNIEFVPENAISGLNYKRAYDLCKEIDLKDLAYVALSLELNGELYTGDKKLINGLRAKGFDQFFES